MHLACVPNSLGPTLVVGRSQVDRLGVVVPPGGKRVITCTLAGPAVHLDLHPADLETLGALPTLASQGSSTAQTRNQHGQTNH